MNELKERLTALGLSEALSEQAIHIMADFVKGQLPENYRPLVDQLLGGEKAKPDLGGLLGSLGGLGELFKK